MSNHGGQPGAKSWLRRVERDTAVMRAIGRHVVEHGGRVDRELIAAQLDLPHPDVVDRVLAQLVAADTVTIAPDGRVLRGFGHSSKTERTRARDNSATP